MSRTLCYVLQGKTFILEGITPETNEPSDTLLDTT